MAAGALTLIPAAGASAVQNPARPQDELEDLGGDEYVLFDCPGQIELYSHVPAMIKLTQELQRMGFRVAATYLLDAQFVADVARFISGVLCCLSAMTALELPHVNVLSKCDLLPSKHALDAFLEADTDDLKSQLDASTRSVFARLNATICELIEEWNIVQFMPLDPNDTDTVDLILAQIDSAIQYHDDVEPKTADDEASTFDR